MDKVIDIQKLILPENAILIKVVQKNSSIILPDTGETPYPNFSHYEVVLTNNPKGIEVEPGDIIVSATGIGNDGGFVKDDVTYIIISGYNIKAIAKPDNFKS